MKRLPQDLAALVLRVAAGLIFLPHGWSKIAGEGGASAFAADIASNYHLPTLLGHLAAWSELAGGVLLLVGLLTRLDALLLAGTMAVATFVVQLPDALYGADPHAIKFFVVLHGIELPLAMLTITVALLLTGGGRFSLDALFGIETRVAAVAGSRGRKRKAAAEAAALEHS
jgi:putative oxidoreductase